MTSRLTDPPYLRFPFRMSASKPRLANRAEHIHGQIEQVLFTLPGERVFRPKFGAGVQALLFEPNSSALWTVTRKRLVASLAEALAGEVEPKTIEVEVEGSEAELRITVSYVLAAIGHSESQTFRVSGGV